MHDDDICLIDCATTHTILRETKYFLNLVVTNDSVSTISSTSDLIEGSGRANIMLPNRTRFHNNDALYSIKSARNLLSFKDIRKNGYHIETKEQNFGFSAEISLKYRLSEGPEMKFPTDNRLAKKSEKKSEKSPKYRKFPIFWRNLETFSHARMCWNF